MKMKKRTKRSRMRGARTCGWGFRQKHKGPGNKGGHGMSGTGKKAAQTKQKSLNIARAAGFKAYFGKRGYTSAAVRKKTLDCMNLIDIKKNMFKKEGQKIDLKSYKILGEGVGFKAEIIAKYASQSAIEKMAKAGGKIILPVVKEKKTTEKKEEKSEAVEKKVTKAAKPAKKK